MFEIIGDITDIAQLRPIMRDIKQRARRSSFIAALPPIMLDPFRSRSHVVIIQEIEFWIEDRGGVGPRLDRFDEMLKWVDAGFHDIGVGREIMSCGEKRIWIEPGLPANF